MRFSLGIALLGTSAGAAQFAGAHSGYEVRQWSIPDGLPQSTVNGIVQLGTGELWLATFGGLARFDGVRFATLDIQASEDVPSQRMTALVPDGQGGLWVATQNDGLMQIREGRVVASLPSPRAGGESVALILDSNQRPWVRLSDGAVFRHDGSTWSEPIGSSGGGRYGSMVAGADGSVWIASSEELLLLGQDSALIRRMPLPSSSLSLALDDDGACWVGLSAGIARARNGALEVIDVEPSLTEATMAILPVDENHVWVGTRGGPLLLTRGASGEAFRRSPVLAKLPADFQVRSFLRDREANVWVGSESNGLVRLSAHGLTTLGLGSPLLPASAIVTGGDGTCWIASTCNGLARFDRNGTILETVAVPKGGSGKGCVYSLLSDSRRRLWIGGQGILMHQVQGKLEVLPLELHGARVTQIVEDASGVVWFSTSDDILRQLDPDDRVSSVHPMDVSIESLVAAADGSLWIGGDGELAQLRHGELLRYGKEHGIPRGAVRDILVDEVGCVWIAAYGGGLGRLEAGRATRFAREQGLPDVSLTRIIDDGRGRLWLLSNAGLLVVSRAELLEVMAGTREKIDPILLGSEAGISEASFGAPAGFKDLDGSIFFPTIRGAVRVDAQHFPFNRTPPVVQIEGLHSDGQAIDLQQPVRVPAQARRLRFDYTAFALTAPQRVHFRFRLEGFDPRWNEVGPERYAEYSSLAPGPYVFEVMARNEHGVWSDRAVRMEFEVLHTWWQRRWVQFAAACATILLFVGLHRLRIAAVHRRGQELVAATEGRRSAEFRESRMREELAHLARASTAGELATSLAHEVNQPLASIVADAAAGRRILARDAPDYAVLKEILADIGAQGERASEVIRRLREFLRKQKVDRRLVSIKELIDLTLPLVRRELEEHSVQLDVQLEPGLPPLSVDSIQFQQVLVILIKNACEALAECKHSRRIVLSAANTSDHISVEVRDNGPGLSAQVAARMFEPYVTTKPNGMGLGLAICRTIVEAHGGGLNVAPAKDGGAAFRFDLPTKESP